MADQPPEPRIGPGLRDYLAAELRQAEVDFPHLPRPVDRRAQGTGPLVTLLAAAVVLLVMVVAGWQLLGRSITGPAAIQLGADGVPTSIDGQPVLRGDEIATRAGAAGSFLAGGTLALASDPCPMDTQPSAATCTESWTLAGTTGAAPRFGLRGVAGAPGFVHTSGALTVVRVEGLAGSTAIASPCADCSGELSVEAVAWRQPTKGPIPPTAAPPQGGMTFDALVPDFVAAWNRDGTAIAGYVPKSYLIGPSQDLLGSPSNPPQSPPIPVYGEDLATLVGHMVPDVGFVPLGATAPPPSLGVSVAPSTAGSPSQAPAAEPTIDCGRIAATPCERAVALARAGNEAELGDATVIVVDDACAPLPVICDRLYPFDAIVVFATAGADTTGWYAFEVTGLAYSTPTRAQPWVDDVPAHIATRLWAVTHPTASGIPETPSPIPGLLTSPPPGRLTRFETAAFSADGRTLTLDFVGGPVYSPRDPCSIAYAGWAEAAGDTLYAAIVDVTEATRPAGAETPQACDATGHGRTVSVVLAAPFTGGRLVDLAGYVHFLRAPDRLVELHGLPAGWTLRSASDVEESPTGRWLRVYSPVASPPQGTSKGHLDVYQAFGGPAGVSGGEEVRTVTVAGQAATLYRSASDGELVLVWTLGGDGVAIAANETDFSADDLVRLAEGATLP